MELGELDEVFFVQYQGSMDRWFTKQPGYATLEEAFERVTEIHDREGSTCRIVRQQTTNEVWWRDEDNRQR